ncbi:AbrB/MazE/SpoVT family DNA-binding domain-containing protein [Methylobacter sp. YRD-M1]|uniref:AbrB/MazE/SpoVT family DNA-binding domain-containing protein n=1 Tax=Methylobacter sp. YRD-M1 TaxID=2911520 RepID=UPI00227BCB8B|nr:AbrB/MazE/SpoVT family DNA-binding domain-containing protein [Methylobacter sp. YRD-M1]WAK03046.1 AbrB/MazE/SpoVT family DNA-binding domain-containing protein [Methylobacter sp. YRD-M1]
MPSLTAQVSAGGRIVIPAEIRRKMGIHSGDQVILSYHDGELHISTRKQRLKQAKDIVKACAGNISLAEQLIEERRAEDDD